MILALDHLVFGNGFGLASPLNDATYHWLVDTSGGVRDGSKGRLYKFNPWFGAQLQSIEWFAPPAGTRRTLGGREFCVFNVTRRGLRAEVSWAMARLPSELEDAHAELREFGQRLGSNLY